MFKKIIIVYFCFITYNWAKITDIFYTPTYLGF